MQDEMSLYLVTVYMICDAIQQESCQRVEVKTL